MRLNAHGVLSVIHDSPISAGVITVYEQSVSVKQISRSVNYAPFWDLCKSQWRNSSVSRCDIPAAWSSKVHPQHSTFSPLLISSSGHKSACSLLHTGAFIPHRGAVASMVGWAEDRLFVSDDSCALCSLLFQFFPQFLLPLILPYFVQSIQSMAKLSRVRRACAVRRDWESFDRNIPVAGVPLTFMGKLSDLVMVGAVFCVIPLYQRSSAISSW